MRANMPRLQATSTGDALAQILTDRAGPNPTDEVVAQIAALATGVDNHFVSGGGGTYTVVFTDNGADLRLTGMERFDDPEQREALLASFIPLDSSAREALEAERPADEDVASYRPAPHFKVNTTFSNRTPLSFTDELVVTGGRVRWVRQNV